MRVVIEIVDGKVKIQVDDGRPVKVEQRVEVDLPGDTVMLKPATKVDDRTLSSETTGDPSCGFCRRKGSACRKHIGYSKTPDHMAKAQDPRGRKPRPANAQQRRFNDRPLATVKPNAAALQQTNPKEPVPVSKRPAEQNDFKDPWNCDMCRNAGSLCQLHQRLADEGKKPPLYRHDRKGLT